MENSDFTRTFKKRMNNFYVEGFDNNLITEMIKIINVANFLFCKTIYSKQAWEPSAVHVTKNYPPPLPALNRFCRKTKFLLLKSTLEYMTLIIYIIYDLLNLESQNQAKNISMGLPSTLTKI